MHIQQPNPPNSVSKTASRLRRNQETVRTWQSIAQQASEETNPERLNELAQELNRALAKYLERKKQS